MKRHHLLQVQQLDLWSIQPFLDPGRKREGGKEILDFYILSLPYLWFLSPLAILSFINRDSVFWSGSSYLKFLDPEVEVLDCVVSLFIYPWLILCFRFLRSWLSPTLLVAEILSFEATAATSKSTQIHEHPALLDPGLFFIWWSKGFIIRYKSRSKNTRVCLLQYNYAKN